MTNILRAASAALAMLVFGISLTGAAHAGAAGEGRTQSPGMKSKPDFQATSYFRFQDPSATLPGIRSGKEPERFRTKSAFAARPFHSIIARYAAIEGIPVSLAHAVIRIESNYRPNARGRAGEIGLMQIKLKTARGMGYRGSADGLYDVETNIKWGMKYLGRAHDLGGGDTCATILRYNAGHGATRMNRVSAAYCGKVKRHMGAI
jgi:soluble lytic murein transglycosylase-like protein